MNIMEIFKVNKSSTGDLYSGLTRRICILFGVLGMTLELLTWFLSGETLPTEFAIIRLVISFAALAIGLFTNRLYTDRVAAWVCTGLLILLPLTIGIEKGGIDATTLSLSISFSVFFTLLLGPKHTLLGTASGAFLILFLAFAPLAAIYSGLTGSPLVPSDTILDSIDALVSLLPLLLCGAATYTVAHQNEIMHEKLNRDAIYDELTGIPNRRAFDRQVVDEVERAQRVNTPLSMMVFDIDNFKMYNDLYGHQEGDRALQAVARAIDGVCVRSTDFVARYGGEEFVALLPSTMDDRAELLAAKIRDNLKRMKCSPAIDQEITVSAGIAVLNGETRINAEELFRRADEALYESKRTGKDCATIYSNEDAPTLQSVK